jgi:alpha-L-arabinofuranosidase
MSIKNWSLYFALLPVFALGHQVAAQQPAGQPSADQQPASHQPAGQQAQITLDASHTLNRIPHNIFGACIEDVNHEIYGGLYDQRIFGESFEEPPAPSAPLAPPASPAPGSSAPPSAKTVSGAWDPINTTADGYFLLDSVDAYNGKQAQIIVHNGGQGVIGVANSGLNRWGIAVRKGNTYTGTVYLKGDNIADGVTVSLQGSNAQITYAHQTIKNITPTWQQYSFALTPDQNDNNARFTISIKSKGKLYIDQVTLKCKQEEFKGLPLRADIATAMQREGLNFVRYGGTMVNAEDYRWKHMIGPRDKRPPYKGHWYPYSTNGFGIEDFVQFCEAAGFEAAFAVNIEETPQDMADMVEYLKGDVSTQWGAQRSANGHPAPYKVKYIEIGNEEVIFHGDVASEYQHYIERFNLLQGAMHAKDTSMKFICSAWWRPESPNMQKVFAGVNGKAAYWDLHVDDDDPHAGRKVDSTLTQMEALFKSWDPQTRLRITIFEENGGHHDLARALGHASTLNAVRRHGDFVLTSCAANALQPLKQNDNDWDQGQVFFTPSQVWGMPPYYAQQMTVANYLPLHIATTTTGNIDVTAATSEDGKTVALYIVNPNNEPCTTRISLRNVNVSNGQAAVTQLAGPFAAENTPAEPTAIIPKMKKIDVKGGELNYTLPPASYTIIRF